mmetsp:Transcript_34686/g.53173  ORF Transcript_34686/g.53173 Transcript_34686/m.53173 type:complete len:96 (+) Transcript_34686:1095-1382(+)
MCESKHEKIKFDLEFPGVQPELTKLLEQCLEFNPYFRSSAEELLKNKIFDKIRDVKMEAPASSPCVLPIDEDGEFDYNEVRSTKHTNEDYIRMII